MAAITSKSEFAYTTSPAPVSPRHLGGADLAMEVFHLTTDATPSDTTLTCKMLSRVLFVVGANGYATVETDLLGVTSASLTDPTAIKLTGAAQPVSTTFTIIAFGRGKA